MNDNFGDRMKAYERNWGSAFLNASDPIYARLDGRAFSTLTKSMRHPYDERMSRAMINVTKHLVEKTHALIGYTQSDEISLTWISDGKEPLFAGRIQKLSSVLSGIASSALTVELFNSGMKKYAIQIPHFDCRVLNLPTKEETANMFLWRSLDARRNAISMAASAHFSHKQLHNVSTRERLNMLHSKGINFEDYPDFFKNGTFVKRFVREVPVTDEMVKHIPVEHRPAIGSTVIRSFIEEFPMREFSLVKNRSGVIFNGEEPNTGWN